MAARPRPAFTLIELLLAMGVISALAAIVIVAINPTHQFAQARNTQRRSDVKSILEAVDQHALDHDSNFAEGVDADWKMLGTAPAGCDVTCGADGGGSDPITMTLSPMADTYLNQGSAGSNYGTDTQLWTDPWTGGNAKRSLIRFDLSGIPAGADITSAQLNLLEADTQGTTRTVAIHRITQDWTENTATWANASSDYDAGSTDSVSVFWSGLPTWDTWNVLADVQDSVDGVQTDYGWLLKDTAEGTSQFRWQFHAREAITSGNRPFLEVTYTDSGIVTEEACLNLSASLLSTYLPEIPADPRYGSGGKTFYAVKSEGNSRLSVRACSAEEGEEISVTR